MPLPVIPNRNDFETWLTSTADAAASLLKPYPAVRMEIMREGAGETSDPDPADETIGGPGSALERPFSPGFKSFRPQYRRTEEINESSASSNLTDLRSQLRTLSVVRVRRSTLSR